MKVISTIYPNKAYPCYIKNVDGRITYTIRDCTGGYLKTSDAFANMPAARTDIKKFYASIDLRAPQCSEFLPYLTWIDEDFYVKRDMSGTYSVVVSTGRDGERSFTLSHGMNYDEAVKKAQRLNNICNGVEQ